MTNVSLSFGLKEFLVKTGIMQFLIRTGLKSRFSTIWRVLKRPHTASYELEVLADYWSFRRRHGSFLADGAHLADPAKKLLVVSLSNKVAQVKVESMLAKAVQLRGYTPIIVTYKSCQRALKYYRIFGFDQFVFFDELIQDASPSSVAGEALTILDQTPSFQSLLGVKYRDVNVGRNVLSSIMRSLRLSKVELSHPRIIALLKQLLPEALQSVLAAEAMLNSIQPQIVLFNEKGYIVNGAIFNMAVNNGINTIQWCGSHKDNSYILKRYTRETRDIHPFSLSDETWDVVGQMPWTKQQELELSQELRGHYEDGTWFSRLHLQYGKRLKSKEEIQQQLGLNPHKKTAVIFPHILWDATFFYGESLFDDYEEWLVETVRAACLNPAVNWIVKLHPANVWKSKHANAVGEFAEQVALRKVGVLPDHIKVLNPDTDISTFSLFNLTDYCLTVRGTIGIEMSCRGIPVFTAGTGRYSGRGFTIDSYSREDYLEKLRRIQDLPKLSPEQTELAKKHAYALFKLRPLEFETFETVYLPLSKASHPLSSNVVLLADSFRDIVEAQDLQAFAEWATNSCQLDFLVPL